MKELTCIICPNGCELQIDENGTVSGNLCPRGEAFARQELTCPKRVLTASVRTIFADTPVISCKTNGEIDRSLLFKAMKEIQSITLKERLSAGSVIIHNLLDTNVDVITTKNM